MVAATLARGEGETVAGEGSGGAGAAEMDKGGQVMHLACVRVRIFRQDSRDLAVQGHGGKLDGVAGEHAGVEPGEPAIVDDGVILLKYWLEVNPDEQTRRLEGRIDDRRKIWKLSDMDLKSYSRWYDYSRARDEMFQASDTSWAPWYVAHSDNKRRARLNILTHILSKIPYEELKREKVELPKRQHHGDYKDPNYPFRLIPEVF